MYKNKTKYFIIIYEILSMYNKKLLSILSEKYFIFRYIYILVHIRQLTFYSKYTNMCKHYNLGNYYFV